MNISEQNLQLIINAFKGGLSQFNTKYIRSGENTTFVVPLAGRGDNVTIYIPHPRSEKGFYQVNGIHVIPNIPTYTPQVIPTEEILETVGDTEVLHFPYRIHQTKLNEKLEYWVNKIRILKKTYEELDI